MRALGRVHRAIASLTLLAFFWGCHAWRPSEIAPNQLGESRAPHAIRITLRDGTRLVLYNPVVREDSVAGTRETPPDARGRRHHPTSVALADIAGVDTREHDGSMTVIAVLAVTAGLFGMAAIGCASGRCGP